VCACGAYVALLGGASTSPLDTTMRTVLFLIVGFLLLAACALLGRLFSTNYPSAPYTATIAFVLLWLGVSAANLWVGVSKAAYSFADELPIFLLIFAVPTIAAMVLKWKFL
jgi:hypothetical protein